MPCKVRSCKSVIVPEINTTELNNLIFYRRNTADLFIYIMILKLKILIKQEVGRIIVELHKMFN